MFWREFNWGLGDPSLMELTFSVGQRDNKQNKEKYVVCHVVVSDIEKNK